MTFLEEIVNNRRSSLEDEKKLKPVQEVRQKAMELFESGYRPPDFLINYISGKPFLVAEIKKSSPSKGLIRGDFNPGEIINSYKSSVHVNAISVLTESRYFSGSYDYLSETAEKSGKPVLMKDFILDEYQILKGFIAGASAVLLIAAILNDDEINALSGLACRLKMKVLFETHTEAEYRRALKFDFRIIGINNRDLKTFITDINSTVRILKAEGKPQNTIIISESGINSKDDINTLYRNGADGFLIGEKFMKQKNIPDAISELFGEDDE